MPIHRKQTGLILFRRPRADSPFVEVKKIGLVGRKKRRRVTWIKDKLKLKFIEYSMQYNKLLNRLRLPNLFLTQLPKGLSKNFSAQTKSFISSAIECKQNFFLRSLKNCNSDAAASTQQLDQTVDNLPKTRSRVPIRQSLLEIAKEINDALSRASNCDISCLIRDIKKWDLRRRAFGGARYEIIALQAGDRVTNSDAKLCQPTCYLKYRNKFQKREAENVSKRVAMNSAKDIHPEQVYLLEASLEHPQKIKLDGFSLFQLPDLSYFHRTLVHLNLSWNNLETLPFDMCHLTRLKVLVLRHNPLRKLPETIALCKALNILDLSHCLLTDVGCKLYELEELVELDLSYNFLDILDSSISKIKNLQKLHLQGNDLMGICPGLLKLTQRLPDLQLDLSNNPLLCLFTEEMEAAGDRVQDLKHLAALEFVRLQQLQKEVQFSQLTETSICIPRGDMSIVTTDHLDPVYSRSGTCCWCSNDRFGRGICVSTHSTDVAGYKGVPITMNCCQRLCETAAKGLSNLEFLSIYCDYP